MGLHQASGRARRERIPGRHGVEVDRLVLVPRPCVRLLHKPLRCEHVRSHAVWQPHHPARRLRRLLLRAIELAEPLAVLAACSVGRGGVEARQRAVERRVRRHRRRPLASPQPRKGRAVRVLDRAGRLGVEMRGGGG